MMDKKKTGRADESLKILKRVIGYMVSNYKGASAAVLACIIVSAAATLKGMMFIQSLVDDYIQPLLAQAVKGRAAGNTQAAGTVLRELDFAPLFTALPDWRHHRLRI